MRTSFPGLALLKEEKELHMRVYLTSFLSAFPWTTLSNPPRLSLRQCAFIRMWTSMETYALTSFRTSGHQLMIAEPSFCPFKAYWESQTMRVLSIAMLPHSGTIKKITRKWYGSSSWMKKHLRADLSTRKKCSSLGRYLSIHFRGERVQFSIKHSRKNTILSFSSVIVDLVLCILDLFFTLIFQDTQKNLHPQFILFLLAYNFSSLLLYKQLNNVNIRALVYS